MVRPSPLRAMLLRTAVAARGPLPAALILSVAAVACGRVEAAGRGHRAISGAEKATTSRPGAFPADTPAVPAQWRFPLHPPITTAPHAMVVTDAPLATHVGVEVLRAGGNAVDAAVATAFALAVVYPEAGNLGGGGFLVLKMADGRRAALDFREKAPLSASRDMYLDAQGNPTRASLEGWLASGVPGSVRGLWAAQRKYGSLPWARVVAPAIRLAEDGFPVDAHLHASLAAYQARLSLDSAAVAILYPGGEVPAEGTRLRNPDLARTLRRIAARGAAGFYVGPTARLIAAAMEAHGGNITERDLAGYRAAWRKPVEFTYRGHRVISMPPSSSGGLTLALIAGILQGYNLERLGWHSPAALQVTAEAMRRAFAARNALLGDPDFVRVPRDSFLSRAHAGVLRASIDTGRATPSAAIRPALTAAEGSNTTHLGVVDRRGNAVALTTTLNELYGSGVAIAGTGFFMNDEMDDFTSKPGTPNMFGLIQGTANAIAPGKRPLSAMTPTIVLDRAGRPLLITGARGGPHIISAAFQVLSNVVDYGMDVGAAVNAPRIHQQHLPDSLFVERNGFPPEVLEALRAKGQAIAPLGAIADAPTILRRGGLWTAGGDPRSGGRAEGY